MAQATNDFQLQMVGKIQSLSTLRSFYLGGEFQHCRFQIDDKVLKMVIWDTVGQERYRSINKAFYRGAKGAFLVHDLSTPLHEEELDYWLSEFKMHADEGCIVILVGNKLDLVTEEEIDPKLIEYAKANNLFLANLSAWTGKNVKETLDILVHNLYDQFYKDYVKPPVDSMIFSTTDRIPYPNKSILTVNPKKKKECCKA